ncbi:hypothetical protein J31TS4_17600 [Paenibacillus sp. J31TS4]|uniref:FIMAH domain-containing protein n=1 Tax=Paenibacillus sp. J31TS4 TaxID=2807195 RepID=UPI001B262545|nr:metallophosphoesterase [Paenibacillus sp. J31TS4]GIP38480.1 hypothetical protein J31TS4_17600 [Paenibacillus sp. J31TS4]
MSRKRPSRWLSAVLALGLAASPLLPNGSGSTAYAAASAASVPPILITELMPDTANVNGADGYEFIEIYNNTDKPLPFGDYKILYRYLESETLWPSVPADVVVPPKGTLVFWIINAYNGEKTTADFNAHFKTQLVEGKDLVKIYAGGMANTRMRELVVTTNTGQELISAFYNEGEQISAPDKAILYRYPEDGSRKMALIDWGKQAGTPGTVGAVQVPETPNAITDRTPPVVTDRTNTAGAVTTQDLAIVAEATDDTLVTSVTLYYRTDGQGDFRQANLRLDRQDGLYRHSLSLLELLGSRSLEYYFVASDGWQQTTSDTFRVSFADRQAGPRLNVKDGQIVSGRTVLRGAAEGVAPEALKLAVDGAEVTGGQPALEGTAYLVFEGNGIGLGNKNAVTIGKDTVAMVDYAVNNFATVVVPVNAELLKAGENTITLRAGSQSGTYYEDNPVTGLDDYDVRNVRLLLSDGTELRDPAYADPAKLIDVGDDGRFLPVVDFSFTIGADKLTALAYPWTTTSAADGPHTVQVRTPDGQSASASVIVDNNGPVITTTVTEGKEYKGPFVLNATVTDAGAGLASTRATLDGTDIRLPYETSSAKLAAGAHEFQVIAEDKAGNKSEKTVRFTVPVEAPDQPVLLGPADGASDVGLQPELRVAVSDPTGDDLTVSFNKGYKYGADSPQVQLFKNATEHEPPAAFAPEGETALTGGEVADLAAKDGRYVTVDSLTEFPYLRFQVKVDGTVNKGDLVEIDWEGKSLPGRKVTMYAWNHATGKWIPAASHVADSEEDFRLVGRLPAGDYVRDQTVNVLVQDLIPARGDYDYTMVWMSDTQFYSELYPHIYQSQVNWIRDNAEEMNIRYVVHTGDLVNEPTATYQWERASEYMKVLEDADMPYGVLAGNHDVGTTNSDYTTYSRYFGADRFEQQPYYGGSYKNNRGHYDLVSYGGNDFLMLYMGWQPEDEDIAWMNQVLRDHPDRQAFLAFHDYMQPNGTRSAMGNKIYEQVVVPNPNVKLVMSGHYTGSSMQTDELDDNGDGKPDRRVYQMLNDYQGFEEGGLGYMKLLHFDIETGNVYVNTYSPYKNDYNYYEPEMYPGKDETTLSFDLTPQLKRVATDVILAKLYTAEAIAGPFQTASGQTATASWTGLAPNVSYSWYALVTDAFGGRTYSDVWSFRTADHKLEAPANLRATDVTDTSVTLAWNPVSSADSVVYDVYQDGASVATVSGAVYQVNGLSPDTSYRFHLIARSASGAVSEPSAALTVLTSGTTISLAALEQATERAIQTGELRGPLAKQLTNSLAQVRGQQDKGHTKQAVQHLENYLKHLANSAMQEHVAPAAKERLNRLAEALLTQLRSL